MHAVFAHITLSLSKDTNKIVTHLKYDAYFILFNITIITDHFKCNILLLI